MDTKLKTKQPKIITKKSNNQLKEIQDDLAKVVKEHKVTKIRAAAIIIGVKEILIRGKFTNVEVGPTFKDTKTLKKLKYTKNKVNYILVYRWYNNEETIELFKESSDEPILSLNNFEIITLTNLDLIKFVVSKINSI